jgi:hypothetical protein
MPIVRNVTPVRYGTTATPIQIDSNCFTVL